MFFRKCSISVLYLPPKKSKHIFLTKCLTLSGAIAGQRFPEGSSIGGEERWATLEGEGGGIMGGIVCNKGGKREGRVGKQLKVLFLVHAYYTLHLLISTKVKPQKTACAVVTCFVDN